MPLRARRILAYNGARGGDVPGGLPAPALVVYGRAQHAYAAASRHQRALRGCHVHAHGEARHHQPAAARQFIAQPRGHLYAVWRGTARADHGDGGLLVHYGQPPAHIEHDGRVVYRRKAAGIIRVLYRPNVHAQVLAVLDYAVGRVEALVFEGGALLLRQAAERGVVAPRREVDLPHPAVAFNQQALHPRAHARQ